MKIKYFLLVLGILFLIIFLIRFLTGEDTWICENGEWIKHGMPDSSKPSEPCDLVGDDKDESGCIPSAGYQWCPSTEKCQRMWEEYCEEFKEQYTGNKTYCTTEQRNVDSCITIYEPVCAYIQLQCITEPCNSNLETYSNSCIACSNPNTIYYVEGECQ